LIFFFFSGWGLTSGGGIFAPNKLQVVEIDIVNQEECNGIFQGYIKPGMICAGEAGAAPCNGDSGGPLVCPDGNGNNKLAGIVSFGENGCTTTGVYTRVSHYEEWISERIVA
jgi:secreted trypsin-like serine protease